MSHKCDSKWEVRLGIVDLVDVWLLLELFNVHKINSDEAFEV